jgi:uncharacterized OB-fold protein
MVLRFDMLEINSLQAPFYEAAARGELVVPWCVATQRPFWPPSPSSPFVDKAEVVWRPIDVGGTVRAKTVFHRAFLTEFEHLLPYAVVLVELEQALRLLVFAATPARISVGEKVTIGVATIVENAAPVPVVVGATGSLL